MKATDYKDTLLRTAYVPLKSDTGCHFTGIFTLAEAIGLNAITYEAPEVIEAFVADLADVEEADELLDADIEDQITFIEERLGVKFDPDYQREMLDEVLEMIGYRLEGARLEKI